MTIYRCYQHITTVRFSHLFRMRSLAIGSHYLSRNTDGDNLNK